MEPKMTTPTDRVRAALNIAIADTDSSVVRELLRKARRELDDKCLVPVEPTECQIDPAIERGLIVRLSADYTWRDYMSDLYKLMIAPYVEGGAQ